MFLAIGSALMAAAFAVPTFDGYMVGNVFLALGGSFIYVPSYAIANAFPAYAGTIVALVTGAFDASAAVFLFYRLAYEATGGAISPVVFFAGYMVVPAAILLAQWTLMEGGGYKSSSAAGEKQLPMTEALCEVSQFHCACVAILLNLSLTRCICRLRTSTMTKLWARLTSVLLTRPVVSGVLCMAFRPYSRSRRHGSF